MHRRRFLLGATMGAVSTLAGCLGGESGGSNNSSNGNNGGEGSGTGTPIPEMILGVQFDGGEMFLEVADKVDRVRLIDPNGQQYGKDNIKQGESTAKFTLITGDGSLGSPIKGYTPGTYVARADQSTDGGHREIVGREVNLNPKLTPTELTTRKDANSVGVALKYQNTGNAPAALKAGRIFVPGYQPDNDEWATSSGNNPIVEPEDVISVETEIRGLNEKYPSTTDTSTGQASNEYCAGETQKLHIEHQMFEEDPVRHTVQAKFSGEPIKRKYHPIMCSEVTLEGGDSVSNNTTRSD